MTEDQKAVVLEIISRQNRHMEILRDLTRKLQIEIHEIEEDKRRLKGLFPIGDLFNL